MRRILLIALTILLIVGSASAYEAKLYDENGNTVNEQNPLQLKPGDSITLSYYATGISTNDVNDDFPYKLVEKAVRAGSPATASPNDIEVIFNNDAKFNPAGSTTYMDVGAITINVNATAPYGALYYVEVGAGDDSDASTATTEFQTVSREIENIPEFPTVALPIAAILGLAFIFQRRKEE